MRKGEGLVVTDYAKYQGFVTQTLEPKLKELMDEREGLVEDFDGYQHVQKFVDQCKAQSSPQMIRNLVDVGCGVMCQAEAVVSLTEMITLKVGLDTYVNLSYDDAAKTAKECEVLIAKKLEQCDEEISNTVNDIEDVLATLAHLKKIESGEV